MNWKNMNAKNSFKKYIWIGGIIAFLLVGWSFDFFDISCRENHTAHFKKPDTTDLPEMIHYLSMEERASIVAEKVEEPEGINRKEAIIAVPQTGDDFRGHTIDEVIWSGKDIRYADFRGVFMRSAHCDNANFSYSDFRMADVKWTSFNHSILRKCNFDQSKMFRSKVSHAVLDSSTMRGSNMFGMEGSKVSMRACDFSNALMKEIDFYEADFSHSTALKTNLLSAVLIESRVDSSDFSYANFIGGHLQGTSFRRSNLIEVDFKGAYLEDADFTGANLEDSDFFGATFKNTVFKNALNIPDNVKELIVDGVANGVCSTRLKNESI